MEIQNLRAKTPGKQKAWTLDQIKAGLEHYKQIHGRYPSSQEIDSYEYLPSARSIQRSHGGLEHIRNIFGLDNTNFTKGKVRSDKAKLTYANAVLYEEKFYEYLINQIPEMKVHEHKILRPGHISCDFYVYTSNTKGYAIDIFYAQDLFTLARIIQIKLHRYKLLPHTIFFVCVGNREINQDSINSLINNKKQPWPKNIKVVNEYEFKRIFESSII